MKEVELLASQNDFEGALADYSKAIVINPNDSDLYYFRGWLRANPEIRDLNGATADFEALKRLEPKNVQNSVLGGY